MALTLTSTGQGGMITLKGGSFGGRFTTSVTPPPPPLLLDTYSSAIVAYSLRKLRTAYSGAAIRVRRSSDNTETDIGFVNNALDTASLLTFCGAGSGFVTTWYDQSGNSKNATETTTARQPQIVGNSVIFLLNGKPVVSCDTVNPWGRMTAVLNISQPISVFVLALPNTNAVSFKTVLSAANQANTDAGFEISVDSSIPATRTYLYSGVAIGDSLSRPSYSLISTLSNGNNSYFYHNNNLVASGNAGTNNVGTLFLGRNWNESAVYNTVYQEIVIYNSNQTTNRANINANINSYYSIY